MEVFDSGIGLRGSFVARRWGVQGFINCNVSQVISPSSHAKVG